MTVASECGGPGPGPGGTRGLATEYGGPRISAAAYAAGDCNLKTVTDPGANLKPGPLGPGPARPGAGSGPLGPAPRRWVRARGPAAEVPRLLRLDRSASGDSDHNS